MARGLLSQASTGMKETRKLLADLGRGRGGRVFAALFDKNGMQSPRGASVVSAEQEVLLVSRSAEMPSVVELFMRRR